MRQQVQVRAQRPAHVRDSGSKRGAVVRSPRFLVVGRTSDALR